MNYTEQEIIDKILSILQEKDINTEGLDYNKELISSGIIDSMSFVNTLLELEDIFEIEIDFENIEFNEITSINGLVKYIIQILG